ncbi:MAG: DNA-binding protein WhiA [Eubacterium sp.]|nr:DNA-binding protein WhiA [Eubacterium sp.]
MSFCTDIKNELCRPEQDEGQRLCIAKGAAFGMNVGVFQTGNKKTAEYLHKTLVDCGCAAKSETVTLGKRSAYIITLTDGAFVEELPDCSSDAAFGAFLRGVFLVCGFASDPEKGYQLEFFLRDKEKTARLSDMINEHGMSVKCSSRRSGSFLYIKDSEKISDMLTFMGAMVQSMTVMNVKIYKELRNNVNRTVNFEAANLDKTIAAAQKQTDDINYIIEKKGIDWLPDELRETAKLRLESIELSFTDIGKRLDPPVSRSGVFRRLKKISQLAERLRNKGE